MYAMTDVQFCPQNIPVSFLSTCSEDLAQIAFYKWIPVAFRSLPTIPPPPGLPNWDIPGLEPVRLLCGLRVIGGRGRLVQGRLEILWSLMQPLLVSTPGR